MKKERSDAIYNNRAYPDKAYDHTSCEECFEPLVFALKDKDHEFSIGLSSILECLNIAEKEGYVPELPAEWWVEVVGLVK